MTENKTINVTKQLEKLLTQLDQAVDVFQEAVEAPVTDTQLVKEEARLILQVVQDINILVDIYAQLGDN